MTDLPYRPCVGVMLINSDGLIFTGERIDTPGAWQMPQGGIDDGEDAQTAALRELEEEIGVRPDQVTVLKASNDWVTYDLPAHLLGKVWGGKYRGQKQKWYLMRLDEGDEAINLETQHPEFGAWRWSNRLDLIENIVPFKRDVYQTVISALLP
ncbi:MAG: RNA pyrophosphohydrolase [Alphaproteobacteria bacterium]|nr:RNA pyrophosphohydrolase [Alphaproteobacteria bacterium]